NRPLADGAHFAPCLGRGPYSELMLPTSSARSSSSADRRSLACCKRSWWPRSPRPCPNGGASPAGGIRRQPRVGEDARRLPGLGDCRRLRRLIALMSSKAPTHRQGGG